MHSVRHKREYPNGSPIGTTRFDGSLMRPVVIKDGQVAQNAVLGNVSTITAANGIIDPADGLVISNPAASTSLFLPAVANVEKGHTITIKKIAAVGVVVTLDGDGAETIEGAATHTITAQNRVVTVVSTGTAWYILNAVTPAAA